MEKWLSISQLSERTSIPESTVRRYLNKFARYFRHEHRGKGKKYPPESCEILKEIASLYSQYYSTGEIDSILSNSAEGEENKPSIQQQMREIEREFEELKTHQESFNKELIHELEKRLEYIKNYMKERDKKLMAALKEIEKIIACN